MRKALGYAYLIEAFRLDVLEPFCQMFEGVGAARQISETPPYVTVFLPPRGTPAERWQEHLSFALKHEGINLEVLKAFFEKVGRDELVAYIRERRVGANRRRVWFLYEFLTGRELPIEPLTAGNYVLLLDPEKMVACGEGPTVQRVRRQRVVNNLPGVAGLCPMVRLTERIRKGMGADLGARLRRVLSDYPMDVLDRANRYFYLKETKSSFAIERQTPDQRRTGSFVVLLQRAGRDTLNAEFLIRSQQAIVDPRYTEAGFRADQVYVGQTLAPGQEKIHFVGLRPQDIPEFMGNFFVLAEKLVRSDMHPVVAAAVVSFLFVFIHPFGDGNGRLHRYLLHHVLAAMGFTPEGVTFPVSAVLYRQPGRYDRMLESFSERLLSRIRDGYRLDDQGVMTVEAETADYYRYIDFTWIVEECFEVIRDTLETELVAELDHLVRWDRVMQAMRRVVDMPDRRAERFARLVMNNGGRLARGKRSHFAELSDDEVIRLERAIAEACGGNGKSS